MRVYTSSHILYTTWREQTQAYRRKPGNNPPPHGEMDFAHAGSFIKKSSPGVFLWVSPHSPHPNSELLLSLHIWELLQGWMWGYCTPPHNAWGLAGKSLAYDPPSYRCACKTEKLYLCEKVKALLLNTTLSFHCDSCMLHTNCNSTVLYYYVVDQCTPPLIVFLLCLLSPGWIFSRRAWGGLRLIPSAVLAGRAHCGGGGDWYPAHLCVLRLPVLPPRICLTVAGLLLCSQVSCQYLDQPCHPFLMSRGILLIYWKKMRWLVVPIAYPG